MAGNEETRPFGGGTLAGYILRSDGSASCLDEPFSRSLNSSSEVANARRSAVTCQPLDAGEQTVSEADAPLAGKASGCRVRITARWLSSTKAPLRSAVTVWPSWPRARAPEGGSCGIG